MLVSGRVSANRSSFMSSFGFFQVDSIASRVAGRIGPHDLDTWLITMVITSPLRIGLWNSLHMAKLKMAEINGGKSETNYVSKSLGNDPPSKGTPNPNWLVKNLPTGYQSTGTLFDRTETSKMRRRTVVTGGVIDLPTANSSMSDISFLYVRTSPAKIVSFINFLGLHIQ